MHWYGISFGTKSRSHSRPSTSKISILQFLLKSVEQSVRYMVLHTVPWWDAMWKLEREIEDGGTGPGDSRGGM